MTSEKKSFLLTQLQKAIDEAVAESGRVNEVVEEMKRSGYDLCLLLESTVTISPMEGYEPDALPEPRLELVDEAPSSANRDFELSEEDLNFLQEMNIAA